MPVNVEIKAHVRDPGRLRALAERGSDSPPERIPQQDVFFASPTGRLKLRVLGADRGELIHYHRPDRPGPKESAYVIAPTSDPDALRRILSTVLETVGAVRKERVLFRWGQTRIHLDAVEGLGNFVELEVVLRPGQSAGQGERIARAILAGLGVGDDQLVEGAYLDLLRQRGRHRPGG